MEGGSGVVPGMGTVVNTAVAVASGCGPAAGGSGCGPVAGGSGCGSAAGGSGCGSAAGGSGRGPVAGRCGRGPVAGGSGCGPAAGGSGRGPVAGRCGRGPVAGGSGCGPAAGGSRRGSAAGGCGRGPVAGGSGCGPAVHGNGCGPAAASGSGPGYPFGPDVDGAAGCKAVAAGASVERRRAALEMEVDPRLDELGIDAQHVAVRHSRYGVAAVIVDRGLAAGAIVGDIVGPDDVLVGAVIGGVGDRRVVRVHLRIGHGDVVDEGVIVPPEFEISPRHVPVFAVS